MFSESDVDSGSSETLSQIGDWLDPFNPNDATRYAISRQAISEWLEIWAPVILGACFIIYNGVTTLIR